MLVLVSLLGKHFGDGTRKGTTLMHSGKMCRCSSKADEAHCITLYILQLMRQGPALADQRINSAFVLAGEGLMSSVNIAMC